MKNRFPELRIMINQLREVWVHVIKQDNEDPLAKMKEPIPQLIGKITQEWDVLEKREVEVDPELRAQFQRVEDDVRILRAYEFLKTMEKLREMICMILEHWGTPME